MQVHFNIDQLPRFNKAVITIGTFDGVHQGHRQIIQNLKEESEKIGGESVIITFHPHPRKVVSSAILGIRLINSLREKIELLTKEGIDHLVVVPFTDGFANQTAEEYIQHFLVDKFQPHTIIIGYDHHFGRDRTGNFLLLEAKAPEYGFKLKEIPEHILNNVAISSTKIREAILHSQIEVANNLLGYDFFFEGEVVHGNKLGRKLGYPTANLKILDEEKLIPGDGIYAVYCQLQDEDFKRKAMMSIGFRPTVDGKKRVAEVYIMDFNKMIYDQTLKVFVRNYLRPEVKFNNLEDLIKQIDQDKIDSLKIL